MRFESCLRYPIVILVMGMIASGCNEPTKVTQDPPCANCAGSQDELVQLLATAYRDRDYARYTDLFTSVTDEAPFFFFLNSPVNGVSNWDVTEELRIHRRMFKPEAPLPGESPVPSELWLASITIDLSRTATNWVERTDLYKTPTNPEGLDAAKWKATEAEFHADILFETLGDTDYRIDGRQNFIMIEDRAKAAGDARKYLIYRWEDLDPAPFPLRNSWSATEPLAWSTFKRAYR